MTMSKTETLEEVERRLEERLRQGVPLKKKPKVEKPLPEAEVFSFNPWKKVGRKWTAYPLGTSSALSYEPTALDRVKEISEANAREARIARIRAGGDQNLYGGIETIEDLISQQMSVGANNERSWGKGVRRSTIIHPGTDPRMQRWRQ
jgi:hypothetical protein